MNIYSTYIISSLNSSAVVDFGTDVDVTRTETDISVKTEITNLNDSTRNVSSFSFSQFCINTQPHLHTNFSFLPLSNHMLQPPRAGHFRNHRLETRATHSYQTLVFL